MQIPFDNSQKPTLVNFGKGRLKCKISFSEETTKPVIQEHPISKQTFNAKYKLGEVFGEGAHAVVKIGWNRKNNEKVAIKVFRTGDTEIINTIKRTFSNTRFLNHPNIVAEKELFINEQTQTSFLVMEFCSFPQLQTFLKEQKTLDEQEIKLIAHDLLVTLQYIHSKGICHRDIKPDNILLNIEALKNLKSPTIKLIDFGVSKRFLQIVPGKIGSEVLDMWTRTGNINYCAPEIFSGGGYNVGIDVWAVGIVLYQCLTNKLPFYRENIMDLIEVITNQELTDHFLDEKFQKASLPLQNFIKQLLKKEPKQRIKVEVDALKHPFLNASNDLMTKSRDEQELQSNTLKMMKDRALVQSHQLNVIQFLGISQKKNIDDNEEDRKIKFQQNIHIFKEGTKLTEIQILKRNDQTVATIDLISSFNSYNKLEGTLGNSRSKEEESHQKIIQNDEITIRKDDPFSQMIQGSLFESLNVGKDQDLKRLDSRLNELDKEFGCLVVQEEDEDL